VCCIFHNTKTIPLFIHELDLSSFIVSVVAAALVLIIIIIIIIIIIAFINYINFELIYLYLDNFRV